MPTINAALAGRLNNFDAIRLVAALCVLFSHSYALTGSAFLEPFRILTTGETTGGEIGVSIFFIVSGFLVTRSILQRDLSSYLASRALRILPALVLICVFDVFVIGPLFTTLPLSSYFASVDTFSHFLNVSIFDLRLGLPGTFMDLPVKAVNGSLWTLPIEVTMYLVLPLLALVGLVTRRSVLALYAGVLLGCILVTWLLGDGIYLILKSVPLWHAFHYGMFFFAGSVLWIYRDCVPLSGALAIVFVLLEFAANGSLGFRWVNYVALPYLVIYAALAKPLPFPSKEIGDLSYGTYVFAFPVQQSIVSLSGQGIGPMALTALAVPLTLMLAFVSWRLIEAPALRYRSHLLPRAQIEQSQNAVANAKRPSTM